MKRLAFTLLQILIVLFCPAIAQEKLIVEDVEIRGNLSILSETIKGYIQTKRGGLYDEAQVQRDFQAILAQGYFDEFKSRVLIEKIRPGTVTIIFEVKELPKIRDVFFEGLQSVLESDVLQRFRERRIAISRDSRYQPLVAENARRALQELLAERGKPNAQVELRVEPITEISLLIYFVVNEGRRVRIAEIDFDGNNLFSDERLRKAMRLIKPAGFLTIFTSKDIYEKRKLDEDLQRVRLFLGEQGFLRAQIGEPLIEPVGEIDPLSILPPSKSDAVRIRIPIREGRRYYFGKIAVEGNTFISTERILAFTGIKPGDVASLKVIREGVYEQLRRLYGHYGYIQATTELNPTYHDDSDTVDFTISIDEGKPFLIRRIAFTGNVYTHESVLRREILVNEQEIYDQDLLDRSRLRLNQLGLFDEIKEEDVKITTDDRAGLVDITINVREKQRQQISFSGGVSSGGSFIGISYSTNNLFGYGESFALETQLGDRQRSFSTTFTEPYLTGRPISGTFSFFTSRTRFFTDGLASGVLNTNTSTNTRFDDALFTQSSIGFGMGLNAPLSLFTNKYLKYTRFTRVGLNYSLSSTKIIDPAVNRDENMGNDIVVSFRQPDITQSTLTPSLAYSTLNRLLDPTSGKSLSASFGVSGLGGDVKLISPRFEFKYFTPLTKGEKRHVLGMRVLVEHISAFGSSPVDNSLAFVGGIPLSNRFFLGGEDSIRGYNTRSISPLVRVDQFITTRDVQAVDVLRKRVLPVLQPGRRFRGVDASVLEKFTFNNARIGNPNFPNFVPIGADTQLLYNVEYRIPIGGPLSFAFFADAGTVFNAAKMNDQAIVSNTALRLLDRDPTFTALGLVQPVTLNPRGLIATPEEIAAARTPETPPDQLPKGFRSVLLQGRYTSTSLVRLSQDLSGFRENFRASVGGELRVQVPVIGAPVRLIFAYNPNARTQPIPASPEPEPRRSFRISIGRTF
ncbi:MAG: outer membrane protein assembly factor BamA [Acidobacteriota bacterium]